MTVTQDTGSRPIAVRRRGRVIAAKVKELVHEGNTRRFVVKDGRDRTVMEIPVTAGVVVAVVAPVATALGAIAALANEWSIDVERPTRPGETVVDAEPLP